MRSRRVLSTSFAALILAPCAAAMAQSASALYTWDNSGNAAPNVENWAKNFGNNTVTIDNSIPGELTMVETGAAGTTVAISDGANRVRESSTASSGGTDLTGLSFLEFDFGHNGSAPVNVQFFVQASTGFNFLALGPDIAVQPGMNTYQVPLSGLTAAQKVYVRTMGFNIRDHAAQGNLTWTCREVRSAGQTLTSRTLVDFNVGSAEGGLQGAIGDFDLAAIAGNNGGQNQTGLSQNAANGTLQWTDLGGSAGAAVAWGNGTAWNGNTFNNRCTDISGYDLCTIRMSATDALGGNGPLSVQAFLQSNGFVFQAMGALASLPTDGQFHDLVFSLSGLTNTNVVELSGVNLGTHTNDLVIQIDSVTFSVVPEPTSAIAFAALGGLGMLRRRRHA